MNDQVRAAVIAVAQSLFPVLILLGVLDLDDTQIAAIMLFITNSLTLVMLAFKKGQTAG